MKETNKKKNKKNTSKKKTTNKVTPKQTIEKEKVEKNIHEESKKEKVVENKSETKEPNSIVSGNEMINLGKIVMAVVAILLIFYGITVLVTKNQKEEKEPTEIIIQYDEILLGTLFQQPNSEYYVLITKEGEHYNNTYNNILSMYSYKENAIRVYNANLDNSFNKKYEADESNISDDLNELKLNGATLLKIKDKKIVASYEGKAKIIEHLKSL